MFDKIFSPTQFHNYVVSQEHVNIEIYNCFENKITAVYKLDLSGFVCTLKNV